MRPVQVYLDTSDYSNFAEIGTSHEKPGVKKIWEFISKLVDSNQIEVRYSYLHLIEILKYSFGHNNLALEKAKRINCLAKGKCFLFLESILLEEIGGWLESKKPVSFEKCSSNEGNWTPNLYDDFKYTKKLVHEQIKEAVNKNPSFTRNQKRQLLSMVIRKGRIRTSFRAQFLGELQKSIEETKKEFPLPEKFYEGRLLEQFLLGDIPDQVFEKELYGSTFDPQNFVENYFEKFDLEKTFPKWLEKYETQIMGYIDNFRNELKGFPKINGQQFDKIFRKLVFKELILKLALERKKKNPFWVKPSEKIIQEQISALNVNDLILLKNLGFSMKAYLKFHYFSSRKTSISDGGDILHSAYLPLVDVFRTDKFFAEILGQSNKKQKTKICPNLLALPEHIKKVLKENVS